MDKQKILIADDSIAIRSYLIGQLTHWGYQVEDYENGSAAWDRYQQPLPPSLMILDWEMPGLSGVEVCRKIKDLNLPSYVYILLLTSRKDKRDVIRGLNSGADDYLTKPFEPDELRARLQVAERVLTYERELKTREYEVRISCYKALTELAETRDHETGAHLERLADMSALLSQAIGMDETYQSQIRVYAPMHDIGKVGIPDRILHKPEKLSSSEFAVIKTHTTLGWQILKEKETLEMASHIAHAHHEKWDGSGYPLGLSGENIPLSGRIVALADVYDALRSRRVYKPSWTHEQAAECIRESSGTHFQPLLAEAFLDHHKEMEEIFDSQAEEEIVIRI